MDDSDLYEQFGKLVRQHRERLGISQNKLADAVSLSRASIANIEAGRQQVSLHHVYRLAKALGIGVSTLLPGAVDTSAKVTIPRIKTAISLSALEEDEVARVYASGATPTARRKR